MITCSVFSSVVLGYITLPLLAVAGFFAHKILRTFQKKRSWLIWFEISVIVIVTYLLWVYFLTWHAMPTKPIT